MIGDFVLAILEGYLAPRNSVRKLLARGHGLLEGLLLTLLGFLISQAFLVAMPGAVTERGSVIGWHVSALIYSAAVFFILSGMIYWFGRISGGTGTRQQTYVVVGWHNLVTSFLAPLFALAIPYMPKVDEATGQFVPTEESGGTALMLAMVAFVTWFWLLAQYICALHGFRNIWGVMGVMFGLPVAISMFLMMLFGGLAVQQ